jgi:O-antigen ligase
VKLLVGISAAVMAIAVPFTSSRGGVISYIAMLSVVVLAWFYREERRENWLPVVAGGPLLGLIVIGTVLYLGGESSMLRGFGVENAAEDISSGRFHFWTVAWKIFLAHPVIGAGLDAFGVAFTRFDTRSGLFRVEQAHNEYLQMLADGGIVGFGLTIAFIFLLVRRTLARIREESNPFLRTTIIGGLAGCVGIFVHSMFDFPLRTVGNAFVFLLIVGLILAPVRSEMFGANAREH